MQILSVPMVNFIRPNIALPNITQIISMALTADFKKFAYSMAMNSLAQAQKDENKLENTQTTLSSSSLQDLGLEKFDQTDEKYIQQNGKSDCAQKDLQKNIDSTGPYNYRRRQSSQKARNQILQAFEQSKIEDDGQIQISGQKEEYMSQKQKFEQKQLISQSKNKNQKTKKIVKEKKVQKVRQPTLQNLPSIVPTIHISMDVSLLQTIQIVYNPIQRIELECKKLSLLSRMLTSQDYEQKKYNYQIRQRKELRKLN